MAPKTRHGASRKRLTFHEKLVPAKGASLPTDALLTKLKTLHTQLAALDQETVDTTSLSTARSELIHTSLLLHKDRGVKAYTACCLADILRLYAPEAPYTQNELRDIFQFFFRQLSAGFKGQDEPYFNEYFHLLESLSTVKSVVLVCDLPSADELLYDIFKDLFTIVKRDFTKKVEIFMADILVALIDECTSLPNDALEVIMAQFVEKNAGPEQPGYRLAVQVCNTAADKLQRNVCQYFGDLLTSHNASSSRARSSTPDEKDSNEEESLRTSHDLIKRLHHACPAVLHSVIPILETELRADSLSPRMLATQTLGEMYADKMSGPDLVRKYPPTWMAWLSRKQDVSVAVRLKCVEAVSGILENLPEQRETLNELLMAKLYDPDERVRTAVCQVYSQLDYEAALHHVSQETLRAVAGRGLDKKASVRTQALNSIGRLYSLAYPEIENKDKAAIAQFGWIPDEILLTTVANAATRSLVEQVLYDYILPLPLISSSSNAKDKEKEKDRDKEVDEAAWTDRLLNTMRALSDKSRTILINLSGIKSTRPNAFDFWLEACIKNNGGIIDEDEESVVKKLKTTTQHLAAMFSDPVKAAEDLQTFAKLNENRLYKLLKTCMDPQTDLKTLIKSSNEFLKRTDHLQSSILPTMCAILRRSSYGIVNQSSVPTLLRRVFQVQKGKDAQHQGKGSGSTSVKGKAHQAALLLNVVAKHSPGLLKPHLGELCRLLASADAESGEVEMDVDVDLEESQTQTQTQTQTQNERRKSKGKEKESNDEKEKIEPKVPSIVEVVLMCLANVVRWDEKLASSIDKKTNERIVRLALGSNWRQAKFAARYLTFCKSKGTLCAEAVESIASTFEKDTERSKNKEKGGEDEDDEDEDEDTQTKAERTAAHAAALAQLARFAPEAFEEKSDVVITYLVKRVLMVRHPPAEDTGDDADNEEEWVEDDDIPPALRAKLQSLKVCRNRCLTHASEEPDKALEIATPALKLFATLVEHEGSLNPQVKDEDPKYKSRMRLQAAISLLHLSTVEVFANAMTPKFVRLACVIQDSCFNVRLAFITKLISFLQPRKIPPRYNVIPFLAVLDPEPDTRIMASAYIGGAKARMPPAMRVEHLEVIFIRLLHLLAHHPDFGATQDELVDLATYVQFYLDLVASSENISLLYYLAQKGKTVRDPESHSSSENFYVICELAQYLIKARAQAHSWTLTTYPGKIKLPSDILRPLPNPEAASEILKTAYLPAEAPQWLAEKFKIGATVKEKKEKKERVPAKRKAAAAATKANGHSKRKKKRSSSDDDRDDDEEDHEASEAGEQGSDAEMEDGAGFKPASSLKSRGGKPRKSDMSEENNAPSSKMTRAERLSARTQAKERLSTGSKKAAQSDDET